MRPQERKSTILLSLGEKLGFATRKQLQIIHGLGGERNATRVLNSLSEYLHIKRSNQNIYYLNQKGREMVGCDRDLKWNIQAEHYLLRNDMYIHFGMPSDWRIEERVKFKIQVDKSLKEMSIVPDATFSIEGRFHFLEVDRTQSMHDNIKKIKQYALLQEAIVKQFTVKPLIVFYTVTKSRKEKLEQLCKTNNLECIVLCTDDI